MLSSRAYGILIGSFLKNHGANSQPYNSKSVSRDLAAVIVAGFVQLGLEILKAGLLSSFIPSSAIKGLLAAIGIILILKQLPHVLLNASHTDYIDPDILSLIRDFKCETAPVLVIQVSVKGFRDFATVSRQVISGGK